MWRKGYTLSPTGGLMPSWSPRNQYLARYSPLGTTALPVPEFLLLNMMLYSMEYPLEQFRSAVLVGSSHRLLPHP